MRKLLPTLMLRDKPGLSIKDLGLGWTRDFGPGLKPVNFLNIFLKLPEIHIQKWGALKLCLNSFF